MHIIQTEEADKEKIYTSTDKTRSSTISVVILGYIIYLFLLIPIYWFLK